MWLEKELEELSSIRQGKSPVDVIGRKHVIDAETPGQTVQRSAVWNGIPSSEADAWLGR